MTTREAFVAEFGEEAAAKIEECASSHGHPGGPDRFISSIAMVIDWECLSRFREHHKIPDAITNDLFESFVKKHYDLGNVELGEGGCSYVGAFAGAFDEFIKKHFDEFIRPVEEEAK